MPQPFARLFPTRTFVPTLAFVAALATFGARTALAVPPFAAEDREWYQLSYPADAGGRTLRELFGRALPAADYGRTWRLYTFDAATGSYVDPGIGGGLANGQGFWFIQATGTGVDLGGGSVPYAVGRATAGCPSPEGCAESALTAPVGEVGWNLVGHPFEAPVDAAALRVVTRAGGSPCGGDGCPVDGGAVATRLFSYDPAAGAYVDLTMGALSPWAGVWVPVMAEVRALRSALLYPDPFCS